ncbi:ubiquitin-like protein [Oryza sativa Japonica Group]|uniref:1-phosphatidylinositol 4-kinase n=1 Tax=Oryza sativa subsp. japonica TaxID=39947 RepID=Q5N9F5_ORYSJ|nr:ubiquitin-like protein [Oryza sativa Japonica Group]BAD81901.1 ubiquitin-like protein [Oryza sativa Japonica Group]
MATVMMETRERMRLGSRPRSGGVDDSEASARRDGTCVLDIRLANADMHAGNILTCRDEQGHGLSLVTIDNGYCLPESFEDCTFEWLCWPQCRQPFSEEMVEYIRSLDAEEDIAILRFHGWDMSGKCERILCVTTMLLKKGVDTGLAAFHMRSILCRDGARRSPDVIDGRRWRLRSKAAAHTLASLVGRHRGANADLGQCGRQGQCGLQDVPSSTR